MAIHHIVIALNLTLHERLALNLRAACGFRAGAAGFE
jgi:hypothetical protein